MMIQRSGAFTCKPLQYFWLLLYDLDLVERFTLFAAELLEIAGCEAGDLLELAAQVCNGGIVELKGNFTEREFVVNEEFLYLFNFLGDEIFFDGGAFNF